MKKTMKRISLLFATVMMIMLLGFSVNALDATGQCGDDVYWNYNESTGELVISGTGPMMDYSSDSPFSGVDSIKSIDIEYGVTTIGDSAFAVCVNLQSVIIGDSVMSIGDDAFAHCHSLTSMTIPDSVTAICRMAFFNCDNLASISIPDSVTSIGSSAFSNTAYYNNNANWQNDVLYIDNHLINANTSLSGIYAIKEGTKCISEFAFWDCRSLTSITIPDSVTSICDFAFDGCGNLTSITIPDSVTSIGRCAFYSCGSLTSITIPDSVTSIGYEAFAYCDDLTNVYYTGTKEQWSIISIGIGTHKLDLTNATIHYNSTGSDNNDDNDLPDNPNTPTDPDTPTDKPKEEPRDFSDYEVISGKFEKFIHSFDINGNECITEVIVDGKKYKIERDYEIPGLSSDTIEYKLGKEVAFAILDGEIVMFESIESISDYCVTAQIEDDLALSCGYGYMTSYTDAIVGESFKENKELKLSAYSLIDRNHLVVRSVDFDEELLEYILSQIPETHFYIEKIQLKLRKTDVISFNGKDAYTISVNSNLKSDQTFEKLVPIKVKSEYEMPEDKSVERVIFDIVITGTRNGEKVEFTNTDHIAIHNGEYVEPTKDKNTNKPTGKQYAKEAAEKLDAISGAITLTGLWELFSSEELEYIGNVLLAEIAMAEAPKETLENYLSKKVIEKLFNIGSPFLSLSNEEIEVTVAGNTKYGEIKLKLICKYSKVAFYGSDYCFTGQVNYEVIGGKGAKKLPGSFKKSGLAGMFSSVDMESFCNSAYKLFETHLHNGIDEVWGNDVDSAADLVFGTIVNDVLAKTELKSVSNIAFELITKPGKSVTVRCPVDVYVYNANDELVAAVVGNEVILTDDKVQISVDGDVKTVKLFDESYNIVYRAIADGEMQITVEEYGTSSGLLNSSTITEIPLIAGRTYTQSIDDEYMEDSDYTVLSASGNKYTPDSTYTTLDGHNYVMIASKEGTCEEGGSKLYACTKCKEFYKEIVPSAHKYRIVDSGKVPTCTEDGYTSSMKCSICGLIILEGERIEARGHDFDGTKCKNCDYDKTQDCSCKCHKGGIAGFFFKLILFFQKLFKTNKTCSCGINHY